MFGLSYMTVAAAVLYPTAAPPGMSVGRATMTA
jgi:hypothetical protein